jgi:hypothetical protein
MIDYHFITHWTFKAPVEKVWAFIYEPEALIGWWHEIREFKIRGKNPNIVKGSKIDIVIRGIPCQFQFNLEVTGIKLKKELHLRSTGDLEGYGILTLKEEAGLTQIKYVWDIKTTKWWANVIGFFFKPLLVWSHNRAMRSGCEALESRLE